MKTQLKTIGLALCVTATGVCGGEVRFKKHVLSREFCSEGCAVADVNKDGRIDVLAGDFWYEAPKFERHEVRKPGTYKWDGGYSDSFANGAMDVNLDGWDDFLVVGFPGKPAKWYENPKGQAGHWKEHEIFRSACNESPQFVDIDKDGRLEMIFAYAPENQMACFKAPARGETAWARHPISTKDAPGTQRFSHGLGIGDVNQDGRNDVVIKDGWWEAPADAKAAEWTFHAAQLSPDCADMHVYDVDDDGDMDIISSSAHNYGIWWCEQGKDGDGNATWTQHEIHKAFSQSHSMCVADINGDGLPDLVTGKRFWAHNGKDPGETEPAVLVWFEFSRQGGKPVWTPHQIDDDSGIGTQFLVRDITADKRPDIIISNKKGTFVFEQVDAR